jgi:hypothetical protein
LVKNNHKTIYFFKKKTLINFANSKNYKTTIKPHFGGFNMGKAPFLAEFYPDQPILWGPQIQAT